MDREKTLETLTEWFDAGMISYENLPKLAEILSNRWVDVNDRLPERNTKVLIAYGKRRGVGYIWDKEIGYVGHTGIMIKPDKWQPLPSAPEDK